jgi:ubiquinone/menaquinone biosynthesis C-methylase UbiE
MVKDKKQICPVEKSNNLDNLFRRLTHNPKRILKPYLKEGMAVLDAGCGPGLFSIDMAKMVGKDGKVIAADLQEGMLKKLEKKIQGKEIEKRITLHKCTDKIIGISKKVDFVLAFYMVHEVPDQKAFFEEMRSVLKPGGIFFIIEPNFHVSKHEFENYIKEAINLGFKPIKRPNVFFSKAVVLKNEN